MLREAGEFPDQVRPTNLALVHRPETELRSAIGDENASNTGKQAAETGAGAVGDDSEHRHEGRRDRPERASKPGLSPTGRVDVLDGLRTRVDAGLLHRDLDGIAQVAFRSRSPGGGGVTRAVQAYKGREVKGLPDPGVVFAKCADLDEDDFRVELMGQITEACSGYSAACTFRSLHVRKALYAFAITSAILLPTLMLVP